MRFLLIDRITEWDPGKRACGVKNVALSEDFFDDHFPLKPIMPAVLMIEGMAQLSGLLLEEGVRQGTGRNVCGEKGEVDLHPFVPGQGNV